VKIQPQWFVTPGKQTNKQNIKSNMLTTHPLDFVSFLVKVGLSEKVMFRRLVLFILSKAAG
jgi:hypothetical protein